MGSAQLGGVPYTEYPVLQGNSYWPAATRNVLHQKENIWNIGAPGLLFGLLEWDSIYLAHMCSVSQQSTECCCTVCFSLSAPPQSPDQQQGVKRAFSPPAPSVQGSAALCEMEQLHSCAGPTFLVDTRVQSQSPSTPHFIWGCRAGLWGGTRDTSRLEGKIRWQSVSLLWTS